MQQPLQKFADDDYLIVGLKEVNDATGEKTRHRGVARDGGDD